MDLSSRSDGNTEPLFVFSPSPALGRVAGDHAGVSFSADDMLPSFEFESTRGSGSTSAGLNTSGNTSQRRSFGAGSPVYLTGELFSSKKERDMESYNSVIVSAVERTIKKYADNILRVLEGISGRLSQLESVTQELEHSIESLRSSVDEYHSEDDVRIRSLNNHVMEMQRAIQILRDKQDIIETHAELDKLRNSKLEAAMEQQNSSPSSLQSLESKQLSLAVVPVMVPPAQHQLPAKDVAPVREATLGMQHLSLAQSMDTTQLHYGALQGNASQQLQAQQVQQQLPMQPTVQQVQQQLPVQPTAQLHQQLQVQQASQLHLQREPEMLQGQMHVSQFHQGGLHQQTQGVQPFSQHGPIIQLQSIPQPIPQHQIHAPQFQGQVQVQQQTPGLLSSGQGSQVKPQVQHASHQDPQRIPTSYQQPQVIRVSTSNQPLQGMLTVSQPMHQQGQDMQMSSSILPSLPSGQTAFPHFPQQSEAQYTLPVSHGTFAPASFQQEGYMVGSTSVHQQIPPTQSLHQAEINFQQSTVGGLPGVQPPYLPGVGQPIAWKDQNARVMPMAHVAHSDLPSRGLPVEAVIEKVVAMGFLRDQVSTVIRRLAERGQAVDVNIVIDMLMKGQDSRHQRGWQG